MDKNEKLDEARGGELKEKEKTLTDHLNKRLLNSFLDRLNFNPNMFPSVSGGVSDNKEQAWEEKDDLGCLGASSYKCDSGKGLVSEGELSGLVEHIREKVSVGQTAAQVPCNVAGSGSRGDSVGNGVSELHDQRSKTRSSERKSCSCLVVGIGGVSCGGKSSLVKGLAEQFQGTLTVHTFYGDQYYHPDDNMPDNVPKDEEYDYFNYDVKEAIKWDVLMQDIKQVVEHEGATTNLVLIESILLYSHKELREACDLRYFMQLDQETCAQRRSLRTDYIPPPCPGYFEKYAWPAYLQHLEEAEDLEGLVYLDGRVPLAVLQQRMARDIEDLLHAYM